MPRPDPSPADLQALIARKPRRRWPWLLAALVLAGLGWLYLDRQGGDAAVSYQTEPVTRGALSVTVTATGTVQPTTEVEVSSELSGTVAAVAVDFNSEVTVGQELARLDDTRFAAEVATASARLAGAEAALAQARASAREAAENRASQAALDKRGIITRLALVSAEALDERARAAVAMAEADLDLARANLDLAKRDLDKTVLRSPIEGVVLSRTAETGQIVAATLNAPVLFTLAENLEQMELQVDIDEADIGRIRVGQQASFTVDAFPGRVFPARIMQVRFAPEVTDGVVTYKAVLTVDNADLLLRPGMTATATITVAEVADALIVPNAALRYAPPQAVEAAQRGGGLIGLIAPRPPGAGQAAGLADGRSIWVLRGGQPVQVAITLGETDGRFTTVSGEGLAEGDLAITDQSTGG